MMPYSLTAGALQDKSKFKLRWLIKDDKYQVRLASEEENVGGRCFVGKCWRSSWWEKPGLALATGVDLPALPFLNFDCHNLPRPSHPVIITITNDKLT